MMEGNIFGHADFSSTIERGEQDQSKWRDVGITSKYHFWPRALSDFHKINFSHFVVRLLLVNNW